MMDQEIKRRWVERLRDPDRKQARGVLRTGDGAQCCLDVLNELGCEAGIQPYPVLKENEDYNEVFAGEHDHPEYFVYDDSHTDYDGKVMPFEQSLDLTHRVMTWAGLEEDNPVVHFPGGKTSSPGHIGNGQFSLTYLNDAYRENLEDAKGLSFLQIADIIEADEYL